MNIDKEHLYYIQNKKIVVPFFFMDACNIVYDKTPLYIYYDIGNYIGDGSDFSNYYNNSWSMWDKFNLVLNFFDDYTEANGYRRIKQNPISTNDYTEKIILPLRYPHFASAIGCKKIFDWFLRPETITGSATVHTPFSIDFDIINTGSTTNISYNLSKQPHGLNGDRSDLISYNTSKKLKMWDNTNNNTYASDTYNTGILKLKQEILKGEYSFKMSVL